MSLSSTACAVRLVAVVVLYQTAPVDSAAFQSLQEALRSLLPGNLDLKILLYDNTPGGADPGFLPAGVRYEAAGRNVGLAAAYNWALDIAQLNGSSWLLLLDQDTSLPLNFLESLCTQIKQYETNTEVVALVPLVRSSLVVVSPKRVGFFRLRALSKFGYGVQNAEIMSINSGVVVRCDFVRSIGGFNRAYWLDYLDHWLFRQIYAAGKKVAVSKCILEHNLSVQDYRQNVSMVRYRSILAGESAFMTTHRSKLQIPFYLIRLVARSVRMAIKRQPDMALFTLAAVAKISMHPTRSLEDNLR